MRSWDEAFLLLPFPELPVNVLPTIREPAAPSGLGVSQQPRPMREAPGAPQDHLPPARTPLTTLDAEGVIYQALVNNLGAKCRHKVHV